MFDIADRLALVKEQEAQIQVRRIALEKRLVAALGFDKPKGSKTYPIKDDQGETVFKVAIDQPVRAHIDQAGWRAIADKFETGQVPIPVRTKFEADAAAVKALQVASPELFMLFCRNAYSTRPGKISVSFRDL